MPTETKPVTGHSYRFDLGSEKSAVDLMFDVKVPGPIDTHKAVEAAKAILEDVIGQDGSDFRPLSYGRLYFHADLVNSDQIVDIHAVEDCNA